MAITIVGAPGPVIWTKNTARFVFSYTLMSAAWKLEVQFLDAVSNAVITTVQYPFSGASGVILMDVEKILDAAVPFNFAPATGSGIASQESLFFFRRIYLKYRPANTGTVQPWVTDPNSYKICRGGISHLNFVNDLLVNNSASVFTPSYFYPSSHKYLTWMPDFRFMAPDESGWLTYFSNDAANTQTVFYSAFYKDGTTTIFQENLAGYGAGDFTHRAWYIPIGIDQCSLDPTGKGVKYYTIKVYKIVGLAYTVLSTLTINVDNRPSYHPLTVYYRNSVGGWDQLRLRGEHEKNLDVEKKEYERRRDAGVNGANPYYDSMLRPSFKVNTGFLTPEMMAAAVDLVNAKDMALLLDDVWIPVRMKSKQLKWNDTRLQRQEAILEFETAGSYATMPKQLMDLL
jgi:hypothetical protein